MSRQGGARPLTLTEELEKLEQSITLTLQEIDSNFNRAHRIVTSSILPIVEQYARHSNDVWEGSKFWKQFFEASANVSLSGYEEPALEEEDITHTETTTTDLDASATPSQADHMPQQQQQAPPAHHTDEEEDSFSVDSPTQVTGTHSTPKLQPSTTKVRTDAGGRSAFAKSTASFRSPSPRKYTGSNPLGQGTPRMVDESEEPSTPRQPQSSPFHPESAFQPTSTAARRGGAPVGGRGHTINDPIMHRGVLDKTYRIQATPHTQQRRPAAPSTRTPATAASASRKLWEDSPLSSPEMDAPQLRSDLFSPQPAARKPAAGGAGRARGGQVAAAGPSIRTPGVSVLTPAARKTGQQQHHPTTSTGRRLFSPEDKTYQHATTAGAGGRRSFSFTPNAAHAARDDFSDDGDDFEDDTDSMLGGMSPPKTLQFHVPQSRLLQTPAREASRRIVEDLLLTAGADGTEELEGEEEIDFEGGYEDYDEEEGGEGMDGDVSPSLVKGRREGIDDTF